MADRNVPTTASIETWRTTYNSSSVDIGDISTLNNTFTGTPTDLVEAVNSKTSQFPRASPSLSRCSVSSRQPATLRSMEQSTATSEVSLVVPPKSPVAQQVRPRHLLCLVVVMETRAAVTPSKVVK